METVAGLVSLTVNTQSPLRLDLQSCLGLVNENPGDKLVKRVSKVLFGVVPVITKLVPFMVKLYNELAEHTDVATVITIRILTEITR